MKNIFFTVLLLFYITAYSQQQKKIDSLEKIFNTTKVDSVKLKTFHDIISLHYYAGSADLKKLSDSLYRLSSRLHNEFYQARALAMLGRYYNRMRQNDTARYYFKRAAKMFKKLNKEDYYAGNISNVAITFIDTPNEDSLNYYMQKALKINLKLQDSVNLFYNYYNLASLANKYNKNEEAIQHILKALKYANNPRFEMYAYGMLGSIYRDMDDKEKSLQYYQKTYKKAKQINDAHGIGVGADGIANLMDDLHKNKDSVFKYYKIALYNFSKIQDLFNVGIENLNIGKWFNKKNMQDSTKIYLQKTVEISKKTGDKDILSQAYRELGMLFTKQKNFNKAENYFELSIQAIDKKTYPKTYAEDLLEFSNLKTKQGKTKEALRLYKEGDSILDAVTSKEKLKTIKEIETKYQTAKKEKENALLKKQKAEQDLEITKRKRQNLLYAGGLGVSLLSLGIFFFFYRKNLKQKQMILNLQRELHHRIKNNLRVITAFINSIKEKFENKEKVDVKEVNYQLNELEKRVQTIYNLHKQLYEGTKVTHLDLDKYINLLTQTIASNYDQAVEMELDIPEGTNIKADNSIILGLILTELTINAFKHAFKKAGGRIKIKIRDLGKQLKIVFSDNGQGLPKDLDIKNLDSFGMRIVRNMTKQMDGEIKMINENGLTYEITIPKK